MSARWIHKNNYVPMQRQDYKERGVSKKERRRRKAALIDAIDTVDISADEALKALKEEMIVDHNGQSGGTTGVSEVRPEP